MLYKLIHGEPITNIKIGRYSLESKEAVSSSNEKTGTCKTGDSNFQNASDSQCLAEAHFSTGFSNNTPKMCLPDWRGSDEISVCSEKEEGLKPLVSSLHYLPEQGLLYSANEVKCEYPTKSSSEIVPQSPSFNIQNANLPTVAYSNLTPAAVVTNKGAMPNNIFVCSKVIPVAGNSEYASSHVSDKYAEHINITDPQIPMTSYAKHPSKDLFHSHKYLHIMEQENSTDMHSPRLNPWQHQLLPQQHEQLPPWQGQQFPQQQKPEQHQYLLPSQLLYQSQSKSRPGGREVVISPYFPNLPSPKPDTKPPEASLTLPYSHVPSQLSTSSFPKFLPQTTPASEFIFQTLNKSSSFPASDETFTNTFNSGLISGRTNQNHEALSHQQQLYPDKASQVIKPNQWHGEWLLSFPTFMSLVNRIKSSFVTCSSLTCNLGYTFIIYGNMR